MQHPIPANLLNHDICTLATKGSGKTICNKGMVERLLDLDRRVVVLDPLGSWYGLKAKADGTPGYKIAVVGGQHADVPLTHDKGADLALLIAKADFSVVIDVSELTHGQDRRAHV